MSLKQFPATMPDYAKDLRLNLGSILSAQIIGDERKLGLLLACAHRFGHLVSTADYGTKPARLRMNFIGQHGIAREEFELFSLAVSTMNGCGMCIDSHEHVLIEHGVKPDEIQSAVRIGAVMKAIATVHATL